MVNLTLIHQADLSINGRTAKDVQPFNFAFQMLLWDAKIVAYSLGISEPDNWKSSLNRYASATCSTAAFASRAQLKNDFNRAYEVLNISYMVWYDYCVELSILYESLSSTELTKKRICFCVYK